MHLAISFPLSELREQRPRRDSSIADFRVYSNSPFWFLKSVLSLLDAKPSDNPELFDVLLTDVDHRILHGGVSEKLGCTYLSRAAETDA